MKIYMSTVTNEIFIVLKSGNFPTVEMSSGVTVQMPRRILTRMKYIGNL